MRSSRGASSTVALVSIGLLVLILLAGVFFWMSGARAAVKLDTQYQAVLLSNGSVFFGKLAGLGSAYPVLTDVYYVQSSTNATTKLVTNILVKRGKEWHSPDRMVLNERSIVFVEPVSPGSKVAELIAESKRKP